MTKINSKVNDTEGIKAIAEALRAGGTLLNAACPICSYPLIKIEDKIYCKICNNEVIIYKNESELPKEYQQLLKLKNHIQEEDSPMIKTLTTKVETLRIQLENSTDTDEIIKLTEAIDKLMAALDKAKGY
ncbi:MAG TPA: Sjogren's syndrome/scleroderma autoantigen 1 family protein [Candidatus Bathyarchaeia archaeon]|nr:Sjogren's syndrome/scleroderma autoantigen 1 family protein [Candidatus Bathyarchaeia archaeon]